jgi:hypothetical protein
MGCPGADIGALTALGAPGCETLAAWVTPAGADATANVGVAAGRTLLSCTSLLSFAAGVAGVGIIAGTTAGSTAGITAGIGSLLWVIADWASIAAGKSPGCGGVAPSG